MKKLFLIPIIALSLVSCGETKSFVKNTSLSSENNIAIFNDYPFQDKKGDAYFSEFQFLFLDNDKSQLTYNFLFASLTLTPSIEIYQYEQKYTFNYTDYIIDEENVVHFYGNDIPYGFTFEYLTEESIAINILTERIVLNTF